ncbi:MAG: DUF6688 family protein [Clostridiaceae bacterium]
MYYIASLFTLCMLMLPFILTIFNILNLFNQRNLKPNLFENLTMILGPLLTVFLFNLLDFKEYYDQLYIKTASEWKVHTPLSSPYVPTIIILLLLGLIGYWVIKTYKLGLPPLLIVICISLMIISSIISTLWIVQLLPHINNIEVVYICVFPLNYIICCISIIKEIIHKHVVIDTEKSNSSNNVFISKCNYLLQNSRNWPMIAIILMIPILAIVLLILIFFGQQPDSVIKAFTNTSDWLLSQKTSPPPVIINPNDHYLCTVSLKGHRRIVKPLRYGIRRNEKIIVNRQLCIANAFEQLIEERFPKTHYIIRSIYDKYGYPLSKHITTPLSADITYIIMKPLEWFFLIVLYIFDKKPEDRIAMQYIPIDIFKHFKSEIKEIQ